MYRVGIVSGIALCFRGCEYRPETPAVLSGTWSRKSEAFRSENALVICKIAKAGLDYVTGATLSGTHRNRQHHRRPEMRFTYRSLRTRGFSSSSRQIGIPVYAPRPAMVYLHHFPRGKHVRVEVAQLRLCPRDFGHTLAQPAGAPFAKRKTRPAHLLDSRLHPCASCLSGCNTQRPSSQFSLLALISVKPKRQHVTSRLPGWRGTIIYGLVQRDCN